MSESKTPYLLKCWDDYDMYLKRWLGKLKSPAFLKQGKVELGYNVPVVLAPVDKAFEVFTQEYECTDLELQVPIISIHRTSWGSFDQTRFNRRQQRKLKFTSDQRGVIQSAPLLPYFLPYTIEFWAQNGTQMGFILHQFMLLFRPVWQGKIDFGDPWGEMFVNIEKTDLSDNTELETDRDNRSPRATASIEVMAWLIPDRYELVPTVLRGGVDIIDSANTLSGSSVESMEMSAQ